MKTRILKTLLIPASFLLILRAEMDPIPLQLSFINGDQLKGEALGWEDDAFLFRTSWGQKITVNPEGLKSWRLQQNTFGYIAKLEEDTTDWSFDRPRMSAVQWEEGVGTHFEAPFSNRITHILPPQGIPPVQVDIKVDFKENAPGMEIYLTPDPNQNHWRYPHIFFKIHQGNIYCGSVRSKTSISKRFPLPQHKGPLTIRMHLDPTANLFRIDINGKELVTWKEEDATLAAKIKFRKIDCNFTVKKPLIVKQFEIKMSGGKDSGKEGPMIELANGDSLPLTAVKWDAQGLWIKMPETDPFSVPSDRIVSVTLPPVKVSDTPTGKIITLLDLSQLTFDHLNEETETLHGTHPYIAEPIAIPKKFKLKK